MNSLRDGKRRSIKNHQPSTTKRRPRIIFRFFQSIPDEVMLDIIKELDFKSFMRFGMVSKKFFQLSNDVCVIKHFISVRFSEEMNKNLKEPENYTFFNFQYFRSQRMVRTIEKWSNWTRNFGWKLAIPPRLSLCQAYSKALYFEDLCNDLQFSFRDLVSVLKSSSKSYGDYFNLLNHVPHRKGDELCKKRFIDFTSIHYVVNNYWRMEQKAILFVLRRTEILCKCLSCIKKRTKSEARKNPTYNHYYPSKQKHCGFLFVLNMADWTDGLTEAPKVGEILKRFPFEPRSFGKLMCAIGISNQPLHPSCSSNNTLLQNDLKISDIIKYLTAQHNIGLIPP